MIKGFTALAFGILVYTVPAHSDVRKMVAAEASRQGVPVGLALSIAKQESNFRCSAVGRSGERGVMQILPRTAKGLGYKGKPAGLNNCQTGIRYGIMYLKLAHKKAGGNTYRTAVLYNGGLGTKRKKSKYAEKVHKQAVSHSRAGR